VIEVGVEELAPLKTGEVLVKVEAAGLNHAETLVRSGAYTVRLPFPFPLGGERSGIVVATGPGSSMPVATRVCWAAVLGSCATFLTAPASACADSGGPKLRRRRVPGSRRPHAPVDSRASGR
jgi:NADPH2:quinone reductase